MVLSEIGRLKGLASLEFRDIRVKFPGEALAESLYITNRSPKAVDRTFKLLSLNLSPVD
jgi:hypothetical protein